MPCWRLSKEQLKRWRRVVGQALRRLDDRIWLAESPLARLKCVEAIAQSEYAGRFLPEGLAVQHILREACEAALAEFADSLSAEALETVLAGGTVREFADRHLLERSVAHGLYWRPVLTFIVGYVLHREEGLRDAA